MNAKDKLARLLEVLSAGKTVYVHTRTRITRITAKDVRRFDVLNRPLFKATERSLYLSVGKRYDCIDYCPITLEG